MKHFQSLEHHCYCSLAVPHLECRSLTAVAGHTGRISEATSHCQLIHLGHHITSVTSPGLIP